MGEDAGTGGAALVAVDWGTTSLRAWLLDAAGSVLDQVRTDDGTLSVSEHADFSRQRAAAFEETFRRLCGGWLRAHPGVAVLAAGMVGSNHGWREAGYLDVPGALTDLSGHLTEVRSDDALVRIVPGLRLAGPDPDVMRGEEVQLVGVLAEGPDDAARTVVLPGTHSKWVQLAGDRVTAFTTTMTGELYGLLMRDSILARLASPPAAAAPSDAFDRGLDTAATRGDERGLLALLFTARSLVLEHRLDPAEVADYVSGLLIGDEVRHALRTPGRGGQHPALGEVTVCGARSTTDRYRRALERHGVTVHTAGEDAACRGLWRIAVDAGLVPTPPARPSPTNPTPPASAHPTTTSQEPPS